MEPRYKRFKTKKEGVFFRIGTGANGREEKVYYIVYRRGGKLIEERVGRQYKDATTPSKAARIRIDRINGREPSNKERREAIKKAKELEAGRPTFNRLWDAYYSEKAGVVKGILTDKYRFELHLRELIGNKEPRELTDLDIKRIEDRMKKTISRKTGQPLAPQTIWHVLQLVTRLAKFGKEGLQAVIKKPKFDNKVTEFLNDEQIKKLISSIHDEINPIAKMLEVAIYTGARRSEIMKLRWKDVDFHNSILTFRNRKGGDDDTLHITMAPQARDLLRSIPRGTSELVFPSEKGTVRKQVYHVVNRVKKRAGLPKEFRGFHGLRHAYASLLATQGVPLFVIQRLLGHRDIRSTQRYSHLADKALRDAADLAASHISQAATGITKTDNEVSQPGRHETLDMSVEAELISTETMKGAA